MNASTIYTFLFASLTLLLGPLGCSGEPQGANTSAPSLTPTHEGARLSIQKVRQDFGDVDDTRHLICEFPFENSGSDTLEIRELKSSCGCTTAELSRMSFLSGEGDTIRVDWKPKGHGLQSQTVDIFIEGAPNPTRLVVRANVEPKIKVTPLAADFGKVPQNTLHNLPLTLRSDDPHVQVIEVRPKVPSALLADFVPSQADGALGIVNVQMLPRSKRGAFGTSITIKSRVQDPLTGEPYEYEMDIPVRASVYGAVLLEPNAFYVGKVLPQGTVDYTVRLRRPDSTSFKIRRAELIDCTVPGLTLTQKEGTDATGVYTDLVLFGSVKDYLGPLRGTVSLLTDVPGDSAQKLGVMGVVRP